jgi:hypothetical protein
MSPRQQDCTDRDARRRLAAPRAQLDLADLSPVTALVLVHEPDNE